MPLVWQLILVGLALSMNNALASVALGAMNMNRAHQLRTAVMFGLFEACMPVIGLVVGSAIADVIGATAKVVGIVVLVILGLYMAFKSSDSDELSANRSAMQGLLLAIALSLDNLTVGFGLGMLDVPIGLAAVIFGAVSLVMTLLGIELGRLIGGRLTVSADKLSGGVLLLVAGIMAFIQ